MEYAEIDDNAWTSIEWRLVGRTMSADALYNRVIASARTSDITIVVVGESMNLVGEGKDRQNLNMNERDVKLLQAVHASGSPAATVLMHGRRS